MAVLALVLKQRHGPLIDHAALQVRRVGVVCFGRGKLQKQGIVGLGKLMLVLSMLLSRHVCPTGEAALCLQMTTTKLIPTCGFS
jgi:hypothetical protein